MGTRHVRPERRLPIGGELIHPGRVSLRVWAPDHRRVATILDGARHALRDDGDGYFSGEVEGRAGSLYGFLLDDDPKLYPDPASRFQPEGPHGLSAIVDPHVYMWHDAGWAGPTAGSEVIYELHLGTFTREGTWRSAGARLAALQDLGITIVQIMPVADFPGAFGWGYDGVGWFAPTRLYGEPDDMRQFVDRAHELGLAVTLDVVYNHVGPDGNYLGAYARPYFTDRHDNDWGEAFNFDGAGADGLRTHVLANVQYWIEEFHLDGLRLDATQQIHDASEDHVIAAIARGARQAAGPRRVFLLAENESQDTRLVRPADEGGYGLDAVYNDDYHHAARVRLTGSRDAYYADYAGTVEELLACVRRGFLFQGQFYPWQEQRRGTPALDLPLSQFVTFLENHDQVANSGTGARLSQLAQPGQLRALTALTLLAPSIPLIFQGQEFGSDRPFLYFADMPEPLASQVADGRRGFLSQFVRIDVSSVPLPSDPATFDACRLDPEANPLRARVFLALHRDLLGLRRALLRAPVPQVEGATLSPHLLLLRYAAAGREDRLLVVNLGADADIMRCAEPLVAPPINRGWAIEWSSEASSYGGSGTPPLEPTRWLISGCAAVLLAATAPPSKTAVRRTGKP